MLELLSKHSLIDLSLKSKGDVDIDDHHTVEDVAIVIGKCIDKALDDKKGISRYGSAYVPMDESLARCVVDLSGRGYTVFKADFTRPKVNDLSTEMVEHFFRSLADNMKANVHIELLYGKNNHHRVEALFKSFAVALREAISANPRIRGIQSTKGKL